MTTANKANGNANQASNGFNDEVFFEALGGSKKDTFDVSEDSPVIASNFIEDALEEQRQKLSADNKAIKQNKDNDDNIDWSKRYADSSNEAIRLAEENKQLQKQMGQIEPFMPILNAMKEDPQMLDHMKGYIEKDGSTPQSIREELKLGDDFVVDMDEAINDPNSDSAKAFGAMVNKFAGNVINNRINQMETNQQERTMQSRIQDEKADLKKKHNLTDNDIRDLDEWAANQPLNYETLYTLKNLKNRDKKIVSQLENDKTVQRSRVASIAPSLGSRGSLSEENEVSDSDLIFDKIRSAMNSGNIFR